jgi:hypothetical protein
MVVLWSVEGGRHMNKKHFHSKSQQHTNTKAVTSPPLLHSKTRKKSCDQAGLAAHRGCAKS